MLIYIDESGHPHPNDSTTRPVLIAMCMEEEAHRAVSGYLFKYKRDLLGRDDPWQIKGRRLLVPRVCQRQPKKWELVQRVFDLIGNTELHIFGIIMERPQEIPYSQPGILPVQHQRLLQRVHIYADQYGKPDEMAILVFDGEGMGGIPGGLAVSICNFLYRHARGRTYTRILDTPLFVDSKITPGIQLVDMIASCIRKYEEYELFRQSPSTEPFLSAIDRFYKVVQRKTLDLDIPQGMLYGFYRMPERYFYLTEEEIPEETEENNNQTV